MNAPAISYPVAVWASDDPTVLIPVTLAYTGADPHAVTLTFLRDSGEPTVTYRFARELLEDGLARPSGVGDVQVRPHETAGHLLVLTLRQEDAYPFEVLAYREHVTEFLDLAGLIVPSDAELASVDMDTEIAALLGGGA
ncbi:SsgA family sporulation/cell division regulator [Sphaerimonospora mesophila]|uniref:SsgA family sporulation/cell division regulator n=1 Tax=Sphaerimonospora mesophila TaxID=37483 RepID=UPI0006E40617